MTTPILCEILANLDFLVQGPTTRSVQDSDYEEYKKGILIRIAGSLRCPLTTKEIEEHLLQALRVRRSYPDHVIDLLFLHGTSMIEVDRESKRQIEEHVKTLYLSDAFKEAPRPRRARSIISDTVKQQKSALSVLTSGPLQSFKKTVYSSRTNEKSAISKLKMAPKRGRKILQHGATKSDDTVPRMENSGVLHCSQVIIPPEAIVNLPISTSDRSLSGRRTSVPETTKRSDDSINSHAPIHLKFEDELSSTSNSQSTHAVMASELAFYKEHYEKAKEKCLVLENQRRQIESLGHLPRDVTRVLNQNTRKVANLRKKLEDRTNLERYLSFSNAPTALSSSQRLIGSFQILKDTIATVLVMDGAKEYPVENLPGISADLDGLLSSVFGIDTLCKYEKIPNAFPTSTSFELIQALTGASIHSWVFGAEFQSHVMGITPLLQEYRSLITTWCGHESLCKLDFAVHQSIIESESFKEVIIPKMSETFTNRLTHALQPFFRESLKRKAIKKLRSSLSAVFKLAVEVRSESLLSANHFELIWPVAGSAANEAEMETINSNPITDAKVVRLPLFPGFRAYAKKKTVVEYRGFAKGTSTGLRQEYMVKALILR